MLTLCALLLSTLLLLTLSALPGLLIRRGERRYADESVALYRDTHPLAEASEPVRRDRREIVWERFWAIRELAFRRSALPGRLADAADIRLWARDHAARTAAMLAGWEEDKRQQHDDWLAGHLRTLGFASVAAVVAEQERAIRETIERMERDVERTDIECTATGSWTERDAAMLREYEAAHPAVRS